MGDTSMMNSSYAGDMASNQEEESQPMNEQNFTPIQSRRFRPTTTVPCWSLCPSMDLIALGTGSVDGNAGDKDQAVPVDEFESLTNKIKVQGNDVGSIEVADSIAVHRIVSWQRLLTLNSEQLTLSREDDVDGDDMDDAEREDLEWHLAEDGGGPLFQSHDIDDQAVAEDTKRKGVTSICWSPDGRCVAVGLVDGGVLIHNVEPDASEAGGADAAGGELTDHHLMHVIRPPPRLKTLPSSDSKGDAANNDIEQSYSRASLNNESAPRTHQNTPLFSPRVTRSMAAKKDRNSINPTSYHIQSDETKFEAGLETNISNIKEDNKISSTDHSAKEDNVYSSAVIGLAWNRISPHHSSWSLSSDEWEMDESWKHSSQLIDRGRCFLPRDSSARDTSKSYNNYGSIEKSGGSPLAHLNVLCVATQEGLHWYLQGRYRILSVPHTSDMAVVERMKMVCSPDLSTVLVVSESAASTSAKEHNHSCSIKATVYSAPLLAKKRFELQRISSSYQSIFSRLRDVRQGMRSSLRSWQSALRPLDMKFQALYRLLCKYNIVSPLKNETNGTASDVAAASDSIRLELLRFILTGRSTVSGDASNAFDQFFTGPQMHDQLFQREARGVEAGVASVEGNLRTNVLSHIRALVYEAEELYGLAKAQGCMVNSAALIDPETALYFYSSARILFLTFERCLARIVEARSRVHDFLAWIRGTSSQVRARGTSMDSVHRQNARNRRVPNGVLQRVSDFLSSPMISVNKGNGVVRSDHRKLTECIIGVPISDFFAGDDFSLKESNDMNVTPSIIRSCTLKSALDLTFRASAVLFNQPRSVIFQSANSLDVRFEAPHSILAIHTRIGAGPKTHDDGERGESRGFFEPCIVNNDQTIDIRSHCWMIFARSLGRGSGIVEVVATPSSSGFGLDLDTGSQSFYLRAALMMPENCEVTNIAFYGDNGSALSPSIYVDAESTEGRQSLGLIVERTMLTSEGDIAAEEELWVFPYDDISFRMFDSSNTTKNEMIISSAPLNDDCCIKLCASDPVDAVDDTSDVSGNVVPKRRLICTHLKDTQSHGISQLNLCGSRGTGGVVTFGASTSLDIFDIEEDEDDDDSEVESECLEE